MRLIVKILFILLMPFIVSGQEEPLSFPKPRKQSILSIKTNIPYWLALLPNAELPTRNRDTVAMYIARIAISATRERLLIG